jgi:flagellar biosynthesis/type III secretory pathway chaperone
MTTIDELEKVLETEADLAEALSGVITQKQQAIVQFNGVSLGALTRRMEELMRPFQDLEQERLRLAGALTQRHAGTGKQMMAKPLTAKELADILGKKDAERILSRATRLRNAVQKIVRMNDQNRLLLQHSLRFVRGTLKIITENHTRQLIDQRM